MVLTRYKPLFSFAASYELADASVSTDGLTVTAAGNSLAAMYGFRLKPLIDNSNTATVFFEGMGTPAAAPVTCQPVVAIDGNQYFYLLVNFSDKEKINNLKFHSSPAVEKEIGFPVLYDALIPAVASPAGVSVREDVKIISPVFTYTVTKAQSGLNTNYASLEIRDENNAVVNLMVLPAPLNDKSIDGPGAVPEYAFSVDASALQPGVYKFTAGAWQKLFFIATDMDITNAVTVIRVLKNNFLGYNTSLTDYSCAQFELRIPKA